MGSRWIEALRCWWRSRSEVSITLPPGAPPVVVTVASAATGLYVLTIGDRPINVQARWYDTPASIARKMRREIARGP